MTQSLSFPLMKEAGVLLLPTILLERYYFLSWLLTYTHIYFSLLVVDDGDFETSLPYIYVLTWIGWCGPKRVRWVQHEMGTAGFGEGISSGGRWRRTLSCDCVLWCKRCLPSWQIRCLPTRAPAWIQAQPPLHCLVSQGEIYLFLQEQQFFFKKLN